MGNMSVPSARRAAFFNTRRGRIFAENLTAYAFIFPAGLIVFLFGVFPVLFAFFVSLHRWRRFPEHYIGLANYERALSDFAYVVFFWLGILALAGAGWSVARTLRAGRWRSIFALISGGALAGTFALLVRWIVLFLPGVMNVPVVLRQLREERSSEAFIREFLNVFRQPTVVEAAHWMLAAAALSMTIALLYVRWTRRNRADTGIPPTAESPYVYAVLGGVLLTIALTLLGLTAEAVGQAAADVQAGEGFAVWAQVILISAGIIMLGTAYYIWRRAVLSESDRRFVLFAFGAVLLVVGGVLLIMELPPALASADRKMLESFAVTAMYSAGTVPFELAFGLGLAYLLFGKIIGRSLFRMIFFLPYITPFIATSVVFSILFSHRGESAINNFVNAFGIPDQKWLLEPTGIFRLIFGPDVPPILAGPSLALVVIMIYTIWTYAGYHTVVFLAGLGNISGELYEAARIDGASGWAVFRHITLPLLSPTTFFLTIVSVIGTFQAFTQIYIMRTPAAGNSVDTVSIYIFEQARNNNPNLGYGSALALVLFGVILVLTFIQNRIAQRRVFYG